MSLSEFKPWSPVFDESMLNPNKLTAFSEKPSYTVTTLRDMLENATADYRRFMCCQGVADHMKAAVARAVKWFADNKVFGVHIKIDKLTEMLPGLDVDGMEEFFLYLEITKSQIMRFLIVGEAGLSRFTLWRSDMVDYTQYDHVLYSWWHVFKNWKTVTEQALKETKANQQELEPVLEFLDNFDKGEGNENTGSDNQGVQGRMP